MCQNPVAKVEVRLLETRRWWDSGWEIKSGNGSEC
jgi:hypothetical protein